MYLYKYLFLLPCWIMICAAIHAQQNIHSIGGDIVTDEGGIPLARCDIKAAKPGHRGAIGRQGAFCPAAVRSGRYAHRHTGRLPALTHGRMGRTDHLHLRLLPSATELDSVTVHTGYQALKPNESTGSFAVIDNKTLNQQVGLNILDRLDGVTNGLLFDRNKNNYSNPNNGTNIAIRGLSTINGPLDPLIVLDNFIYEGNIANINPNDVESVTVLKDAAAASIWGARAGNGVIVITTKKGGFGRHPVLDFNTDIIVGAKPDLHYLPQMSSPDYIDMEQYLFNQGYFNSQANIPYTALTPAVEVFLARRNGSISVADSAARIDALKKIDSRDQYQKYFYRKSVLQQYALNMRGGSDNLSWLLSGTYDKSVGNLRNEYGKVNLRMENTYRPIRALEVSMGVYYTHSRTLSGAPDYNTVKVNNRSVPYLQFADEAGNALPVASYYRNAYLDTTGAGKLLDWHYYPLEDWKHSRTTTVLNEAVANAGLRWQVAKGLSAELRYQYQQQSSSAVTLTDTASYGARNTVNLYSQLNRPTGVVKYIVPLGAILQTTGASVRSHNGRAQLNYARDFGAHAVTALAGMEIREVHNWGSGDILYGYNADPLYYSVVDFVNTYPTWVTGSYAKITNGISRSETVNRFVSQFANFSYVYGQRYTLSGSIRRDGSNIFGANTNDKWKPLWSSGIGWDLSKETFYKVGWLPRLRIRATYGVSGNVDASKTPLPIATYGTSDAGYPYARINSLNDPDLRWEQSAQFNIGLDFGISHERLSGSVEYYRKKGTDLYGPADLDYTSGFGTATANVANMKGKGMDIQLRSVNTRGALRWVTQLITDYSRDKTTAYNVDEAESQLSIIGNSGTKINPVVGYPLYAIAAYRWAGLDTQGNPQGILNGQKSTDYASIFQDGATNGLDSRGVRYFGSATPVVFGSVINTLEWHRVALSFNVTYKLGYYFWKSTISYASLVNYGIGHSDYALRWQQPGDELKTNVPAFVYPLNSNRDVFYNSSELNVLKGDHIRLKYINLSYTPVVKSKRFEQLQVYANAANLGILWRQNRYGLDPDYPSTVPPAKTFAIGVRCRFK